MVKTWLKWTINWQPRTTEWPNFRVYCSIMTVVTDLTTKIIMKSRGMNQVNTIFMKLDTFCKSDADDECTLKCRLAPTHVLTSRTLQLPRTWYWHRQRKQTWMVAPTSPYWKCNWRQRRSTAVKEQDIYILRTFCLQFWLPVRVKLLIGWHWFTLRGFKTRWHDATGDKNGMTCLIKQRDMFILLLALREPCSLQQLWSH